LPLQAADLAACCRYRTARCRGHLASAACDRRGVVRERLFRAFRVHRLRFPQDRARSMPGWIRRCL